MTSQMKHRLDVFKNCMLRKICGPVTYTYDAEEGVWRIRHNMELREITRVPLISEIKTKMGPARHVVHREEECLVKLVAFLQPAAET